jgi:hypothetical protein
MQSTDLFKEYRMKTNVRKGLVRHWMTLAAGTALLAMGVALYAGPSDGDEGNGPKVNDKSNTGETLWLHATIPANPGVEPLFAAPSDKATVHRASYGTGNLIYHGGPVMKTPGFYAVYWNSAVAAASGSLGYSTIQNQIAAFATTFLQGGTYPGSGSDDYTIVGQYTDSTGNKPLPGGGYKGTVLDNKATQTTITDSAIQTYLTGLFNASKLPVDTTAVYGVYFPSGMQVQLSGSASCSSFCGYHSVFTYGNSRIKYAVFPYPDCSGCKLSNLTVADMLTIIGSHEIREAATDPGDSGNAWYDRRGYEADDKCAWHNLYQMNHGSGNNFWVQPEYSNGGTVNGSTYPGPGCVVNLP